MNVPGNELRVEDDLSTEWRESQEPISENEICEQLKSRLFRAIRQPEQRKGKHEKETYIIKNEIDPSTFLSREFLD